MRRRLTSESFTSMRVSATVRIAKVVYMAIRSITGLIPLKPVN